MCMLTGKEFLIFSTDFVCKGVDNYTPLIGVGEALLWSWLVGLVVLAYYLIARKPYSKGFIFLAYTLAWSTLSFVVYSFVKYKTPWLILNLTLPLILLLCAWINLLFERKASLLFFLSGSILFWSGVVSLHFNFKNLSSKTNPLMYVHTHQGMLDLVSDIKNYIQDKPKSRILVGVDQYWPLPYYLRDYADKLAYLSDPKPKNYTKEYQVMILDSSKPWKSKKHAAKYYRLSDVQESYTYFSLK